MDVGRRECSLEPELYDETENEEVDELWETGCDHKGASACNCFTQAEESLKKLENGLLTIEEDPFNFVENDEFWGQKKHTDEKVTRKVKGEPNSTTKKCSPVNIVRTLETVVCCETKCLQQIPANLVEEKRHLYWRKNVSERRAFLTSAAERSLAFGRDGGRGPAKKPFVEGGVPCCTRAWCTIFGISLASYYERLGKCRKELEDEEEMENQGRGRSVAYNLALDWFTEFMEGADRMPDCATLTLPSCLTKLAVYQLYREQMNGKPLLARTSFIYGMWKKHFPYVTIPKQSRFSKCAVCVYIKERLTCPKTTSQSRARLSLMRKIHLTQQLAERQKYYKHGLKAKAHPEKYLSVIIDGMDQGKHNLPHLSTSTKVDGSAWRLKTHITGALANHRSEAAAYLDICQWPHDSNLTINVLLHLLLWLQTKLGRLPAVLYLQMDNCWRECKNRFILAFLALLVQIGIFKKIKLCFLMVGHTHEDVDQLFSCISRRLNKNNALTLLELLKEIGLSYSPSINASLLTFMYDVKQWMENYAEKDLTGHVDQHQFKITKGSDGKAKLKYKKWSTSSTWLPEDSEGLTLLRGVPEGSPPVIQWNRDKMNLDKVKADIAKFRLHFSTEISEWWDKFFRNDGQVEESHPRWIIPLLRKTEDEDLPEPEQSCETSQAEAELIRLITREEREVEVQAGRKRHRGNTSRGRRKAKK